MQDGRIDRAALAVMLEQTAQRAEQGEEQGSPWFVAAQQIRHLIATLEAAPPAPVLSIADQMAQVIADAEAAVSAALNDLTADRAELAAKLSEAADYYADSEEEGSPWFLAAQRLRELVTSLGAAPSGAA